MLDSFKKIEEKQLIKILSSLLFILTLAVYFATLCPTVYIGDSGEFITNAVTLGINHTPGYPLHALLANITIHLSPFLSLPKSVNIFSALCASLTVVSLFYSLLTLTKRKEISFFCALLYGFSFTLWSRATIAEIYTLSILSAAIVIQLTLQWYSTRNLKYLALAVFCGGLGLSQHPTSALIAVSVLLFVLVVDRSIFQLKTIAIFLTLFIIGFSVYLYLPVRAIANPPFDTDNPETLQNAITHIFPQKAVNVTKRENKEGKDRTLWVVKQFATKEFWYFGAIALVGIFAIRKDKKLLLFFLSIVLFNAWYSIRSRIALSADFDAYLLPTYHVGALLIGVGLAFLTELITERIIESQRQRMTFLLYGIMILLPLLCLKKNYTESNKSDVYFGYDAGQNIINSLDSNAILLTRADEDSFLSMYFRYAEKSREDIDVVMLPYLTKSWYEPKILAGLDSVRFRNGISAQEGALNCIEQLLASKRPVYCSLGLMIEEMKNRFQIQEQGLLIRIYAKTDTLKQLPELKISFHEGANGSNTDYRTAIFYHDMYFARLISYSNECYEKNDLENAQKGLDQIDEIPTLIDKFDNFNKYLLRGMIHLKRNNGAAAMTELNVADSIMPENSIVYEKFGYAKFYMQEYEKAREYWQKSLILNPKNQPVQENLQKLNTLLHL